MCICALLENMFHFSDYSLGLIHTRTSNKISIIKSIITMKVRYIIPSSYSQPLKIEFVRRIFLTVYMLLLLYYEKETIISG